MNKRAHVTITVGHTPDMDDAFMFYAIAEGRLPTAGLAFRHVIEDIQALNQRALKAELDVTAISAASLPAVAQNYWVLSVGSSVGEGYGPLVIAKTAKTPAELDGARIAVPGLQTTAALLLRLAVPRHQPIPMRFDEVPDAVRQGRVDAGLVIHEWQLVYKDAGLIAVLDLGLWWQQQANLPLPLGLNVVKRTLGKTLAGRVAWILQESIRYARAHQPDALAYAMRYGRGVDAGRSQQFVDMYVNEETLCLTARGRLGLGELLARAKAARIIDQVPTVAIIDPVLDALRNTASA